MHEGYGIPVLEAMHYGVFPIVRGGNAMEEVVGDQGQVFSIVSNYIFEPHLKNNKVTDIDIAYELQQSFQNLYKYIRSF
jgi:glycosyltransferase involved in cell wall biosynthesis